MRQENMEILQREADEVPAPKNGTPRLQVDENAHLSVRSHEKPRGFRLSALEVYNWGTFDGAVHVFQPRGATSLLVGENGSGKSTLVDAMLTLLVEKRTRNYNVAAGAKRNERDERTYIRGAYDRTAGSDGKPEIQYLRSGHQHYSALLGVFENQQSEQVFTICQVLYLTPNNEVKRIFAFSDSRRTIARDLADLKSGSEIKATLKDRGFQTTENYRQYLAWMQRRVKFRAKAMDVFNQTVAVKDVQQLDQFIRQHMLEKKPWNEKVAKLLNHFEQLSEAHRALVQVQQKAKLLKPILEAGKKYTTHFEQRQTVQLQQAASELYFESAIEVLLSPLCDQWRLRIDHLSEQIKVHDKLLRTRRDDIARLNHDIENAGGARLRQLPGLIDQQRQLAKSKRDARLRFEAMLHKASISVPLTSAEQLAKIHRMIAERIESVLTDRIANREKLATLQYELGSLQRSIDSDLAELNALRQRKGNLPQSFIEIRDRLCNVLRLSIRDLPYVAELVSVQAENRQWEGSIEQVLHGFARTLLVPDDLYARVSGYINQSRLTDGTGRGYRLTYDRIGPPREIQDNPSSDLSLADMLVYRTEHPLTPYVRAEILARFNYLAYDSIETFQMASVPAMTPNRHIKKGRRRHEKDDRSQPNDRRHFVLGWDNRDKMRALEETLKEQKDQLDSVTRLVNKTQAATEHATSLLDTLANASEVTDFDDIDDYRHEFDASQLVLERQRLEESSDQIKQLKVKRGQVESEVEGLETERERFSEERTLKTRELETGTKRRDAAKEKLNTAKQKGTLETARKQFASIQAELTESPLCLDNLETLPVTFERELQARLREIDDKLNPSHNELTKAMSRMLAKFPDLQTDLDSTPQSLPSFIAYQQRIDQDDLPRHERRFKQRLNENVVNEIGFLNGKLENERVEIKSKIELLNKALRRLDWRPGTYMRLEPRDTTDVEIREFCRQLTGCLSGTLGGTSEANEQTFHRIEKLVNKLRDDANLRWREKVIDVRNWFNFAAREFDAETSQPGSYYDGGTGQSGGEKGKLAFLVLVAAIAYQYDIQPDQPNSDRFHFVMVDEMFSRSDDARARYALDLFERFGLQLAIVAPLDAKARVTEQHVGMYAHVVKDPKTNRSELISLTAEQYRGIQDEDKKSRLG